MSICVGVVCYLAAHTHAAFAEKPEKQKKKKIKIKYKKKRQKVNEPLQRCNCYNNNNNNNNKYYCSRRLPNMESLKYRHWLKHTVVKAKEEK